MIKIGNAYFDDDFNWGVTPSFDPGDRGRYIVALTSGVKLNVECSRDEIEKALSSVHGAELEKIIK